MWAREIPPVPTNATLVFKIGLLYKGVSPPLILNSTRKNAVCQRPKLAFLSLTPLDKSVTIFPPFSQ